MKKLKTQTGLQKQGKKPSSTARKDSSGKAGKVSNKKVAKQRKQKKLAEKKETKKRKQGGAGRPFRPKPWGDYAKGEKPVGQYSTEELRDIVRRTSKAANARLRALEKAGYTKWAYKSAQRLTGKETPRFTERTGKMTRQQLTSEFVALRDFMTRPTSTISGHKAQEEFYRKKAEEYGYTGDAMSLTALFDKYMTKEWEDILGSETIYLEIMSGRAARGSLEEMREKRTKELEFNGAVESDKQEGARLLAAMKKYGGKT